MLSLSTSKEWKAGVSILYGGPNRTELDALRPGGHTGRFVVRERSFVGRDGGRECDEQMQHHDGYINPTRDAKPTAARHPGHQGDPVYSTPEGWWLVTPSWGGRSGRDRATPPLAMPRRARQERTIKYEARS